MKPTIIEAITAGGYTPINLPAYCSCSAYSLWTEDGAAYYIASDSAGADGILVTSNGTVGFPISVSEKYGKSATGEILCYAKGTSSTNLVGIITA